MSNSTLYTIGTALSRARDSDTPVSILVSGEWIPGEVHAVDEFGVVLAGVDAEHSVIRIESIDAVKVSARAPFRSSLPPAGRPMPSPRTPTWS